MTIRAGSPGEWVSIDNNGLALRCWWSVDGDSLGDADTITQINRVYIVLPEVFGVNAWVRGVAGRISLEGNPALAMPLFARTAPKLELGYSDDDLLEGRWHKDLTTTDQILIDLSASIGWMQARYPAAEIAVVGFCFGGHAALLAATLPSVSSSIDFYGAGVSRTRPGGGPPSLELLSCVKGRLTCVCGTQDPLIPVEDRAAIQAALSFENPSGERLRYVEVEGADHGFMCEARSNYNPVAAARGWELLLEDLETSDR